MKNTLAISISALLLVLIPGVVQADRSASGLAHWDIRRSDWPQKPSAAAISKLKPLQQLFKHYRNQRAKVEIRYPGGREGRKWATEVQGWLVALGIPTKHIVISVGVDDPDRLRLAVIPQL